MLPKISIIIATYNSGKTLRDTIRSIISQTYKNIELIIIDGNSKDNTLDIITEYSDYIGYFISEADDGIYYALNKGIDAATGDYICIIGSDDFFFDINVIEMVVENIDTNTDILSTSCYIVDEDLNIQLYYGNSHAKVKDRFPGWMIPHAGMYVKNAILKKYKFDVRYKIAADYDFFLKCYYDDNILFKFVDIPTYYFSNSGASSNEELIAKEVKKIKKSYGIREEVKIRSKSVYYIKQKIKKFLDFIGLGKFWRIKFTHWEIHKCNNDYCRLCRCIR